MRILAPLVAALIAFAACATTTESENPDADRTVAIQMRDNHFEPDEVEVRRGDTVSFQFVNRGSNRHDAFIGDEDAQEEHETEARTADDGEHEGGHAAEEEDAITLEPGDRAELNYRFTERGEILIGCHEPGHYADGMIVTVNVQ
jgi:uncharacterized cupredoxin-like copper-binding protein